MRPTKRTRKIKELEAQERPNPLSRQLAEELNRAAWPEEEGAEAYTYET
jgi:hypothetical protein